MTITRYTTEDGRGVKSDLDTGNYRDAVDYAQTAGHCVIALEYEFVDSSPVPEADFIEWHWHTTTTDPRTTEHITACSDSELGARDDLVDVLDELLDQLSGCDTSRLTETTAVIARLRALAALDETLTVTLAIGLPTPVTYTITKVLGDDCDLTAPEAT